MSMIKMSNIKRLSLADLKNNTLLILSASYPNESSSFIASSFVKYQINELKHFFKKIIVISPVFNSLGCLQKDKYCKDYIYDNVEVYYPRCYYLPIEWSKFFLIDNRLDVVERCIKENNLRFDIIHAHFTWPSGYIGVRLKKKFGVPVIITIHENGDWFNQEVMMNHPLINTTWSSADVLIRVNQKDVPVLKRFNEQVYSIPNGFSATFYPIDAVNAKNQLGLPCDVMIVFTLGYLIKRKGFNYLIDAMERVCRQQDNVYCFIGGDGPERGNLQRQINRLRLNAQVKLLGSLPNDKLTIWMNACDIFVLPSLNEGNPTVMFEAIGCGKPFVGTKVGGVPEIITSNKYGLLVEPGNLEDLSEKILLALHEEWDKVAILKYAEQFTWECVSNQIIKLYRYCGAPLNAQENS